jgi:hypothetical protein
MTIEHVLVIFAEASSPDVWDNAYEALIELDFAELTSYQADMGRVDAVSKIFFIPSFTTADFLPFHGQRVVRLSPSHLAEDEATLLQPLEDRLDFLLADPVESDEPDF